MGKKRTAAQFFDDAVTNGHEPLAETDLNGDKVSKGIEDGTQANYKRMLDLWDEYKKRNPGASPCDTKTAKHFIEGVVRGCSAGKESPSLNTMLQKWTDFGAGWKRRPGNTKIPSETSESIYFYIETELRKKFNLSIDRRIRHYMTVHHFVILMKHMWKQDWHQYKHPRTLVQDFAAYLLFIYTSARVGEYFESNMRRGSGRGLWYKHIDFVIFRNEDGKAEIAIRVMRDAKGFTNTPHKRPKHGMYEDMEPLFANPVLPLLAISLADEAFQDYNTFEEIEAIPPPADGSLHHLRIKNEILDVPFFQHATSDGPTGKIQAAVSFSNRTVALGHRAGYQENIGIHDFRAEVLVRADGKLSNVKRVQIAGSNNTKDNGYSAAERMKFAGHNNADTFFGSYVPQLSTVDGISSYWKRKQRTIHLEGFRGLSLHCHPQMLQSLPAKVEADLEARPDLIAINQEIEALKEKLRCIPTGDESQSNRARREDLYWQKRQLVSEELNKWQKKQPRKIKPSTESEASTVTTLPSYFSRIRRLDPPRDRLASLLFLRVPLRSLDGRRALEDMITLCKENPPVAYRPSLRPEAGRCPVRSCAQEMNDIRIVNRWNHIYRCYKADLEKQHGFAQLCFQCDDWVTSKAGWHEHCLSHLNDFKTLPAQCNPLIFRYTPAAAGQCLFCLFNRKLSATERFQQFTVKRDWKNHMQEHFWQLEQTHNGAQRKSESKVIVCPDPRCALVFVSTADLQCHCQDIHCVDRITLEPVRKRRRINQPVVEVKQGFRSKAKVDYCLDIYDGESHPESVGGTMAPFTPEQVSTFVRTGSVAPDEKDLLIASNKRSPSIVSSLTSEEFSVNVGVDVDTPASLICADPPLPIDPRLFDNLAS